MILDSIIVIALILCLLYGLKKGFVFTLIHMVGWIVSTVLAYFATPHVASFMEKKTSLLPWFETNLENHLGDSLTTVEESFHHLSIIIKALVTPAGSEIPIETSLSLARIFFILFCFILAFSVIKILLGLLAHFFSKDYGGKGLHFFDRLLGGITGLFMGGAIVLLGLTLLTFLSGIFPTGLGELFNNQLESSYLSREIFENNALLVLLQNYIKT